jgi:hypothetical protein
VPVEDVPPPEDLLDELPHAASATVAAINANAAAYRLDWRENTFLSSIRTHVTSVMNIWDDAQRRQPTEPSR